MAIHPSRRKALLQASTSHSQVTREAGSAAGSLAGTVTGSRGNLNEGWADMTDNNDNFDFSSSFVRHESVGLFSGLKTQWKFVGTKPQVTPRRQQAPTLRLATKIKWRCHMPDATADFG